MVGPPSHATRPAAALIMRAGRSRVPPLRRVLAASLSTATLLFLISLLLRCRRRMLPRPAAGGEDASDHCESEPQAAQADSDRPALATERAEASVPRQMEGMERRSAKAELSITAATKPLLASSAGDQTVVATPSCSGAASPVEEDERENQREAHPLHPPQSPRTCKPHRT